MNWLRAQLRLIFSPPPSFAEVHDGPDYAKSMVTIELTNNSRAKGTLLKFNAVDETVRILEPRAVVPTDIVMSTIKYMRLENPTN